MTQVLIIEDDPDLLFLYHTALAQHGFGITQAEDARSAISELDKQRFDAVILDLNLPDAHGSVVVEHIIKKKALEPQRIVIITANDHWVDSIRERGVQHLLVKPIGMNTVVATIKKVTQPDG